MKKVWQLQENSQTEYSGLDIGLTATTLSILQKRGINSTEGILDFLRPSLLDVHSPFLFQDMAAVISRIARAKENQEKILIYGDYDVDGITSTALLYKVFQKLGLDAYVYIPHRSEGYGIKKDVVEKAAQSAVKLIVSVDCGITAVEEVLLAAEIGIDFIITDHHEPQNELPASLAIINPKVPGSGYPFRELAGVGVAYKLVQALGQEFGQGAPADFCECAYLDLVALGTIADVVPLTGENRILVASGLRQMKNTIHTGLRALLAECGLAARVPKAGQIAFIVAPRINAAGRLDTAKAALNLLLEENDEEALALAAQLSRENAHRQDVQGKILAEAEEMLDQEQLPDVIVLSSPDWHHGVIGIVASKLVERYYRPVFIIAEADGVGKGSARGISGYHVLKELQEQAGLLTHFGGHQQAAGFTLPIENIALLRKALNEGICSLGGELFKQKVAVDSEIMMEEIDLGLFAEIEQLAPFGMGNPAPLFVTKGVNIREACTVGKEKKHLKLRLEAAKQSVIEAMAFNIGESLESFQTAQTVDLVYNIDKNEYLGREKIQISIRDYDLVSERELDIVIRQSLFQTDAMPVLNRGILVRLYLELKNRAEKANPFLFEVQNKTEKSILKVFEEMGMLTVCGGAGPFLLKLNKVKDKLNLDHSLRYRVSNSPILDGKV